MTPGHNVGLIASVESWDAVDAIDAGEACEAEHARRDRLLAIARAQPSRDEFAAQLVLAADQFLISPSHARRGRSARARRGRRVRAPSSPAITGSPTGAATR